MKNHLSLLAALLAGFAASTLSAQMSGMMESSPHYGYLRPFIFYAEPTGGELSGRVGGGIVSGIYLGEFQEHDAGFEWSTVQWSQTETAPGIVLNFKTRMMPILFSYRYRFGDPSWRLRPYIGPSVGLTSTKMSASGSVENFGAVRDSDSSWDFTWSGSAGISVAASDRFDLDLGYRYLHAAGSSYTLFGGTTPDTGAKKTQMGYAGVAFRF